MYSWRQSTDKCQSYWSFPYRHKIWRTLYVVITSCSDDSPDIAIYSCATEAHLSYIEKLFIQWSPWLHWQAILFFFQYVFFFLMWLDCWSRARPMWYFCYRILEGIQNKIIEVCQVGWSRRRLIRRHSPWYDPIAKLFVFFFVFFVNTVMLCRGIPL